MHRPISYCSFSELQSLFIEYTWNRSNLLGHLEGNCVVFSSLRYLQYAACVLAKSKQGQSVNSVM